MKKIIILLIVIIRVLFLNNYDDKNAAFKKIESGDKFPSFELLNQNGIVQYTFNSQFDTEKHVENSLQKINEL